METKVIDNSAASNKLEADLRAIARLAAGVVVAGSLVIIFAQLRGIQELKFAMLGTALSFALSGVSLILFISSSAKPIRIAGSVCAALVALLAGINALAYLLNTDLPGMLPPLQALAMSPSDSIEMLLIGLAQVSMPLQIGRLCPSGLLAFCAAVIALMSLLGVILHIDTFCLFMACTKINMVQGLAFAFLSVATLIAAPKQGLTSLMASTNAGGVLARRLLPAIFVVPLFFSWLRMQLEQLGVPANAALPGMISAMVIVFSLMLWWNAFSLDRADRERQEANARLVQTERRMRMIIQQAIDAFIAIDAVGTIKDWNERAEYTFGWSREEALGKSIYETFVPENQAQNARDLIVLLMSGEAHREGLKPREAVVRHKDGHEFPIEVSLFPVFIDSEKLLCGFTRDITERKEVEHRFREFYSTVSHELRSPLSSIRGSIELMGDYVEENLFDNIKPLLGPASESVDRLIRLINDLLDVKRIEEGQLNLEFRAVDPIDIAKSAADGLRGAALKNKVEITVVIEDAHKFPADPDRIVQVLTNLLTNAIKFSPPDGVVTLRVHLSDDCSMLRFDVEDLGPGIKPADLHRLFSPFGQLADGRRHLGTGLGLAISKAIVEQHNGEIGIQSNNGAGSTFWFALPLHR
jgi:PAS domain S-box-containing protein